MLPRNLQHCRRLLERMDFVLLFCMLVLLAVGVLTIYGAGQKAGGAFETYWLRQLAGIGIGFMLFHACLLIDYRQLGRDAWILYGAMLILLVLVLVMGLVVNRSRSWIAVIPGFTLQPAEVAKPATLFFLAWTLSRPALRIKGWGSLAPHLLVLAVPMGLIILQPDVGTALVFLGIAAPMFFLAGFRWKWILILLTIVAVALPVGYKVLENYQHQQLTAAQASRGGGQKYERSRIYNRLHTFLHPSENADSSGWNARQALLAVGSGGAAGKGFMKGTQHELGFLPRTVAPTDFIFSVIGEENGFIGSLVVVGAFLIIILRCLRISALADDDFGAFMAAGVAGMFFTHAYINIGMNVYAAPIIGIPLPLISYGGSFILCSLVCLGLMQSVYVHRRQVE